MGTLAADLGLTGTVAAAEFRRILDGRHPWSGDYLLSAKGSAMRAARRRVCRVAAGQAGLFDGEGLDVARAAARLRLTCRHIRRLLAAGERSQSGEKVAPSACLVGTKVEIAKRAYPQWRVQEAELSRFETERRHVKARPGYDLTLRPPKSVSILWALGNPEQRSAVRRAHREAVDAVVAYYEAQAIFARQGGGGRLPMVTDGLIGAAFDHRTSRAGDPLLHSHVVVANMTRTAEGRWQTLNSPILFDHARSGGYVYQAHLRHVLSRDAGLDWQQVRNGWAEVAGVPEPVIRAFSKRRDEIEELVAESGYTSARAHQAATLASRRAKDNTAAPETLLERWQAEAAGLGFDGDAVDACFGRVPPAELSHERIERLYVDMTGPRGLTERSSTFTRREVVEALAGGLGATADAATIGVLTDRLLASQRVVPLEGRGGRRRSEWVVGRDGRLTRTAGSVLFSTPEMLATEARLLHWAEHGFGTVVPTALPEAVAEAIGARPELSGEQRAMIEAVCLSGGAIQPVAGRPGSGKTHATEACVAAFLASGRPVLGCALSATAADELERACALGARTGRPASTIARLLCELDAPNGSGLAPGTILFVDEASMAGTRGLARLAVHVARSGGAIKLIGDPDQHGPVEAGGVFRKLVADRGDDVVSLVENNRQVDTDERRAIDEYRQGRIGEAIARYERHGKVHRAPTAVESYRAIVNDWYEGWNEGSRDPMMAGPNSTRRALNMAARARLRAEGALKGEALVVGGSEFQVGDWIVTRHNDYRLSGPAPRSFVKNGSVGTVVQVGRRSKELVVEFARDGRITLPRSYVEGGWVEHGYARTTYGVEGATLTSGHYHVGDGSSFEEGYVALTRAKQGTQIYVVEGTAQSDLESEHRSHETESIGLETVIEALGQPHTNALAMEIDGVAADAVGEFGGWDIDSVGAERHRLDEIMASMPARAGVSLAAAQLHRETLIARRQLLDCRSQALAVSGGDAVINEGSPTSRREPDASRAALTDRALLSIEQRIGELVKRDVAQKAFLADHAGDVSRRDAAAHAERGHRLGLAIADQIPRPGSG